MVEINIDLPTVIKFTMGIDPLLSHCKRGVSPYFEFIVIRWFKRKNHFISQCKFNLGRDPLFFLSLPLKNPAAGH